MKTEEKKLLASKAIEAIKTETNDPLKIRKALSAAYRQINQQIPTKPKTTAAPKKK